MRTVRLTTQSEPKILMEVMPAGMVVSLLALTYLFFAQGCGLIVRQNIQGTSTLNVPEYDGASCGESGAVPVPNPTTASAAGCTNFSSENSEGFLSSPHGAVFNGYFAGMTDLYGSVSLHASFENDTALESLPDPAVVDLELSACTDGPGDGENWGTCGEGWAKVLVQV